MRLKLPTVYSVRRIFPEFQYQKGAIKTLSASATTIAEIPFQYQKGAIKTIIARDALRRQRRDFNTKKVRLKRISIEIADQSIQKFQYQKGAIKTGRSHAPRHPDRRFQYQKGAIKTKGGRRKCRWMSYFNTKKVRLKQLTAELTALLQLLFQYQKGAIKTASSVAKKSSRNDISIPKRCD